MKKTTSYLVTGGNGFIGCALVEKLNGDICIVTRHKIPKKFLQKNTIRRLIKSVEQLTKHDLNGVDIIYHCASTVDNYHILTDPMLDIDTNIKETIHLLELCKKLQKKPKILFLSTFFVYGNLYQKYKKPLNENSPTDPLSLYSASKLCAENIISLYGRLYKIPYVIARLTNIYGPGDRATDRKGVLNYFAKRAAEGKDLNIYGGGKFKRDYLYIDDLVDALFILEKKGNNELFLVGSGKSTNFKEAIRSIHKLSGSTSKIVSIPVPEFHKVVGVFDFVGDFKKINNLGFRSKTDLNVGFKKLIDGMRK